MCCPVCKMVSQTCVKQIPYTVCKPVCCPQTITCSHLVAKQVPYTVTRCVPRVICTQVPVKVCCPVPACPHCHRLARPAKAAAPDLAERC